MSTEDLPIDLGILNFTFTTKPLVIGGMAMQYYGLRPSGADIDLVVTRQDRASLAALYPQHQKDLGGDLGVCVDVFEIWQTICLFDYEELSGGAIDLGDYRMISLEKLLFLKALAMKEPKYHRDLELIVARVHQLQAAQVGPGE